PIDGGLEAAEFFARAGRAGIIENATILIRGERVAGCTRRRLSAGQVGGSSIRGNGRRNWAPFLGAAALFVMGAALLLIGSPASATGTGDYPAPASGNWWITQPSTVANETIVLEGSLYVYTGSLQLDNVTLLFHSSSGAQYGIVLYASAALTINNSNVTTSDTAYRFYFYTYGTLSIERSEIQRMADYGIYTY